MTRGEERSIQDGASTLKLLRSFLIKSSATKRRIGAHRAAGNDG